MDKIGRCFFYSSDFRNPHKEASLITYVRHQSLVRHRTNYNRVERKRCLIFWGSISNCGKDPEKVSSSYSSSTKPTQTNQSTQNNQNQPKPDSPVLNSFWPLSSQSQRRSFPLMSFAHFDFQIFLAFLSLHSRHLPFWSFISTSPPSLTAFIVLFPPQCSS